MKKLSRVECKAESAATIYAKYIDDGRYVVLPKGISIEYTSATMCEGKVILTRISPISGKVIRRRVAPDSIVELEASQDG